MPARKFQVHFVKYEVDPSVACGRQRDGWGERNRRRPLTSRDVAEVTCTWCLAVMREKGWIQ